MRPAALFTLTGVAFFAYWLIAKPSYAMSETQGEWPYVLAFSAMILTLSFAVPQFAQLVAGRVAVWTSRVVAAGAMLSSAANVLEDGFRMGWAFFAFILGTAIIVTGLLALTIAIVARPRRRHLAVVPAGTLAGLLFYVAAGGPIMLATWLVAAAFARAPILKQVEPVSTAS